MARRPHFNSPKSRRSCKKELKQFKQTEQETKLGVYGRNERKGRVSVIRARVSVFSCKRIEGALGCFKIFVLIVNIDMQYSKDNKTEKPKVSDLPLINGV